MTHHQSHRRARYGIEFVCVVLSLVFALSVGAQDAASTEVPTNEPPTPTLESPAVATDVPTLTPSDPTEAPSLTPLPTETASDVPPSPEATNTPISSDGIPTLTPS